MQKEINFYQEMASEHRLQEYSKGTVPLYSLYLPLFPKVPHLVLIDGRFRPYLKENLSFDLYP